MAKATSMADLMKSVSVSFVSPKKGDVLEGTISKLTSAEILVDIGAKTEAVVLEKDRKILKSLLTTLKVGDKVNVAVLNPESDLGNPVVSLRRFNENRVWEKMESLIKNKEQVEAIVDEATKGGFLVSTKDGISGFLPNSQASFIEGAQASVGKTIKVSIIELNRSLKKVIFSQKTAGSSAEFEKLAKNLKRGQKVESTISNIASFGMFTLIDTAGVQIEGAAQTPSQRTLSGGKGSALEGFVHISEIAWEKIPSVPATYKQGDKIEAEILGIDRDSKRVNLSIKRLLQNPFEEKLKEFTKDLRVSGTVTKVLSTGISVDLGQGLEGFIKKEKIPPTVKYSEGNTIETVVVEVDKKQRVILAPVLKEKPIGYR